MLQRVNFTENQQIIKKDIDNLQNFQANDFYQVFKNVTNPSTYIVNGFEIFQDSATTDPTLLLSPVYVKLESSTLIHSEKDVSSGEPGFYVGAIGTSAKELALTSNATNYIELDLTTSTGASDIRTFYDPSNSVSFSQDIHTVGYIDASLTVNTTGWSGGDKIAIAEITLNSSGDIVSSYDRRNLFWRVAKGNTYDGDYKYTWPNGRYESTHTLTLGIPSGAYLFVQDTPATTWTINHNLNKQFVSFTYYNEFNEAIVPNTVVASTADTLVATFTSAQAGKCVITIGTPSSQYYDHVAGVAATTWNIAHNLGTKYVNIRCYDSSDNFIIPDSILAVDANNATVTFLTATSGNAFVTEGGNSGNFAVVNQAGSSTTWTINHGLSTRYVDVSAYSSTDEVFYPSTITIIDEDNIEITLSSADTGNVAVGAGGGSGEYLDGEIIEGGTSGTTAKVITGGLLTITVESKSSPSFTIGETINGLTSGAANTLNTVKESFNSGDKAITNLKDMLNAIMTEITIIKHGDNINRPWFSALENGIEQIRPKVLGRIANTGTPSLTSGRNIATVISLGTGQVQITFTEALDTSNFIVQVTMDSTPGFWAVGTRTTSSVIIETFNTSAVATDIGFNITIHEV